MKAFLTFITVILFASCIDASATEFTLFTAGGHVTFAVGDNWGVVAMETKKPNQTAAFQVPMSGEMDSDPPTNVSIILINPQLPEAEKALSEIGHSFGPSAVTPSSYKGWSTFRQKANDSGISYTIVDAKKSIADIVTWVRFAWPTARDQEAEPLLLGLLDSIKGGMGEYKPRDGETIYRPVK